LERLLNYYGGHLSNVNFLFVFQSISHYWNHDTDPVETLQINKYVQQLRDSLKDDPQFLQKKVKQYF